MKVYISGKINGEPNYEQIFEDGARTIAAYGHEVVNPCEVKACADSQCAIDGGEPLNGHVWECWLKHDLIEMLKCDAVCLLPNWMTSKGANLEADVAQSVNMPVYGLESEFWSTNA